jgi:hypothetical protein
VGAALSLRMAPLLSTCFMVPIGLATFPANGSRIRCARSRVVRSPFGSPCGRSTSPDDEVVELALSSARSSN